MTFSDMPPAGGAEAIPLGTLLHLGRRARHAASTAELGFIAVNETHLLTPYRQAALWLADRGVTALSGVVAPEANAPFVFWLERVAEKMSAPSDEESSSTDPRPVERDMLAAADAEEWDEWLPEFALWVPLPAFGKSGGGLLLARDTPWSAAETALLAEWADSWSHAWSRLHKPDSASRLRALTNGIKSLDPRHVAWRTLGRRLRERLRSFRWSNLPRASRSAAMSAWRNRRARYAILVLAVMLFPVRLTVLGAGELVPANPAVIRAPLEGTIDQIFVSPNAQVKSGTKLFQLDLTTLTSKLKVAEQALATAEAEYRQVAQQAVFEAKSKSQLAVLEGRIAERSTEVDYLNAQLTRAQVTAPRDGVVLFDDPTEWIGKPVIIGERVMALADERDVEVEVWLALGDAIELAPGAPVTLYLNSAPLSPVSAQLRYRAHEAAHRPDGSFAYRVRATLREGEARPRIGLKGTAKLEGKRVPLLYWIMRRPLAIVRQAIGF